MSEEGDEHRILEFFSGIGGMRYSANSWASHSPNRSAKVLQAFDVSDLCNKVYAHNFGDKPSPKSVEHLDAAFLDSKGADTWLMSPPCQPYTAMGLQRDTEDPRARALLHLCKVIGQMSNPPSYILLENVNNFQTSQSHELWLEALESAGYITHEFLLTPPQLGIPNERLRYYCLARKKDIPGWDSSLCGQLMRQIPGNSAVVPPPESQQQEEEEAGSDEQEDKSEQAASGFQSESENGVAEYVDLNKVRSVHYTHCKTISEYLDEGPADPGLWVKDADLMKWKGWVFDIVTPESQRCSCFTKSYTKYIRGTGSLLSHNFYGENGRCLLEGENPQGEQGLEKMKLLQLRYFSETEVSRLMGFPVESFGSPPGLNARAMYRLLGNSINVSVVSALLEHLWVN